MKLRVTTVSESFYPRVVISSVPPLPTLSKLLEHVYAQLMDCIVRNNVLARHKSGFRPPSMINILIAFMQDLFIPPRGAELAGDPAGDSAFTTSDVDDCDL